MMQTAISTVDDVRQMAEAMSRDELIAAMVRAAEDSDAAETLIDELKEGIAMFDTVVSRHPAALEDYQQAMLPV
ncbi:hypothetical protein [Congregibacter litoralis]|uniref:Uncharacterized protein n=1 Tax=Congregibacter litoralis KT71 TaxID=314285 RepID=A4ADH9_9GAMM|nr:hypothetical protein [Congregibacter litoralis]EAQ95977.1 hypothetical protein KT71_18277 [Congregibacter litoralis KT71]